MATVNFWPILVASVVAFIISALWYSPILFGKEWMALSKISAADVEASKAKGMWKLYLIQFIVTLVTFSVLGFIITAAGPMSASDGAFLGFLAWLGFVATTAIGGMLWENKPLKLVLIQTISMLLNLVIGGSIIGVWR